MQILHKAYAFVGKTRARNWHTFLVIGIAVGLFLGIVADANRNWTLLKESGINYQAEYKVYEVKVNLNLDTKQDAGQVKLLTGFVHGITYDASKNYTKTIDLISQLKPKFWRLANYSNDVYGFVADRARFPRTQGTLITFVIQDAFNIKYGMPPIRVGNCDFQPSRPTCFASFEELKNAWTANIETLMRNIASQNVEIQYFDIFSEPDWTWEGVTPSQLFELFKSAHTIIRKHQPSAKIAGPSMSLYSETALTAFLNYAATNKLGLDALTWHEFDDPPTNPETVVDHVAKMRNIITAYPQLCSPTCPEIHINEYLGHRKHLIPGWNVGWLYYLEKAGVDQAHKACWDVQSGRFNKWSTCWAGFEGMLLEDNVTPQHPYWVFKAYADGEGGKRFFSESASNRVLALASRHDDKETIKILAGRYDGISGKVTLTVNNYPYRASEVAVKIQKIPTNKGVPLALASPISLPPQTLTVKQNSFSVSIDNLQDGEAYILDITARSSAAANPLMRFGMDGADVRWVKIFEELNNVYSGVNGLEWGTIEPQKSKFGKHFYRWNDLDGVLRTFQSAGRPLQVNIRLFNDWAMEYDKQKITTHPGTGKRIGTFLRVKPAHLSDWTSFVANFVERYDGDGKDDMSGLKYPVTYIQIESEAENSWANANGYVEALCAAYKAAKKANSNVQILAGGFNVGDFFLLAPEKQTSILKDPFAKNKHDFLINFFSKTKNCFDILSLHLNRGYESIPPTAEWFSRQMKSNGYQKPIWSEDTTSGPFLSEETAEEKEKFELLKNNDKDVIKWFREEQANFLVKKAVIAFASGIDKVFISTEADWPKYHMPVWRNMGLLDAQGKPKPAYYSFKTMVAKLEGFTKVERLNLSKDVFSYRFTKPFGDVYVLWSEGETIIDLPAKAVKVTITDILGKESEALASRLRVSTSPIYIEERPHK